MSFTLVALNKSCGKLQLKSFQKGKEAFLETEKKGKTAKQIEREVAIHLAEVSIYENLGGVKTTWH